MYGANVHSENKINLLGNNLQILNGLSNKDCCTNRDFRILSGEIVIDSLRIEDIVEILEYGWDHNDLQRMLDSQDWNGIAVLAAWIRECGDVDHGLIVEDDSDIYNYHLDEDGNYIDEYSEEDDAKVGVY